MTQEGFFSKTETASISRPDGKKLTCASCLRYQNCKTPRFKPQGNGKKKILNIFELPSTEDDKTGKFLQSKSGRLLTKTYKSLGVDVMEDCLNMYALACYSDTPYTTHNIDCCRRFVLGTIQEFKPSVIVLFGNVPLQTVIGHRWRKELGGIQKWRGWTIPDQDFGCWICPVFSPEYVERSFGEFDKITAENTVWVNDLKAVLGLPMVEFPIYKEPEIEIIEDLEVLNTIKHDFAFDFETTGLKPNALGHKIVSCAIADSSDHAYVFMMPQKRSLRLPLVELLENPKIGKVIQNCKYEITWAEVILKCKVENVIMDTMLMTHTMDNRSGITGLKFQTYVLLGEIDYSSMIEPYLKGVEDKNANALNRVLELVSTESGKQTLLKYNALDAINTYRIWKLQELEQMPF